MNAPLSFDAPHGFKPSQPRINPASLSVANIIRWIDARKPLPAGRWNEIGQEEFARSFTAARTAGSDVIVDLYNAFRETIEEGGLEQGFADRVIPILKEKRWLEGDDGELASRVELIYNTNIRMAQAVSKWREAQTNKRYLPFMRYVGVADARERRSHVLLNDIVRPVDDPIWNTIFPPCGFRCRCSTIQYTRGQFERRQMKLTPPGEAEERIERAIALDPGFWAFNPGNRGEQALAEMTDAANERALPGAAPIEPTVEAARGRNAWAEIIGDAIGQTIENLLDPEN